MGLTLVTTTRNRSLAFSFLERWISRQTVRPDRWIVVNDGEEDYSYSLGQEVYRRKTAKDRLPSICENWRFALRKLGPEDEKVFAIEDDDYYHPAYLQIMAGLLDSHSLAGVNGDLYYNFKYLQFKQLRNISHASLAATAFRPEVFPVLREIAERGNIFLDMLVWDEWAGSSYLRPNLFEKRALHVGLKCLPGEPGLGSGHLPDGCSDPLMLRLVEWLGIEDARVYVNQPWDRGSLPAGTYRPV